MNIKQLIEELEFVDPDVEVRIAQQPSWPLQYHVGAIVQDETTGVVYLAEAGQVYDEPYLPAHVAELLGWRDEPENGGWEGAR
jgi:hypothetical protein